MISGAEVCFHKELGWIDGAEGLNKSAIKAIMKDLNDTKYDSKVDECASWNSARYTKEPYY